MPIIGLVLILASVVLGVGAVFDGSESTTVEVLGTTVHTSVGAVFLAGALTMLLFVSGAWILTSSLGRARRKSVERKEVKRRQRDSVTRLEQERTQLRAENERLSGQLGQRSDGVAADDATTGHEPVTEHGDTHTADGSDKRDQTEVDGAPTEQGAHTRRETNLGGAESSAASRSGEGKV